MGVGLSPAPRATSQPNQSPPFLSTTFCRAPSSTRAWRTCGGRTTWASKSSGAPVGPFWTDCMATQEALNSPPCLIEPHMGG